MKTQAPIADLAPPLKLSHQVLSRMGFLGVREVADYGDQRPYRPKRAEETINTVHAAARGARLEQPDHVLINMIEREEPKARYFPIAPTPGFKKSPMGFMNARGYEHRVLFPLDAQIRKDFPNQLVLTKTTHVSINGSVRLRDAVILDAVDAAQQVEGEGPGAYDIVQIDTSQPTQNRYYPFKDYVGELAELRRHVSQEGRGEDIFPAVIVYDPTYMERDGYATRLSGSAEDAVLGVYILDAPLAGYRL